jgi:subtilisin family serine protease
LKVQSGTSTAAPHVAGVAALWWQAVRQSDLPANATLVRGKLLASAARDGFSLAVYPGDRGAGRVVAPRDSAAVSPRRAASERPRNAVEDTATDHAHQWAFGRQFEPISLDSQLVNLGRAGGGYLS